MEHRWIWPFELEEQIGSGAMGVVYRARFVKNDKRVALKLLPPEIAADPTLAARFQREMELLKELKHPHIVHSFGGLCEGKQWFYAMELVDGGTVESLIRSEGRIRWRDAVRLALQTCSALEHAHTHGVIHRDLKPGNLLLTRSGELKLGDFGLATMASESKLTAAGKTVGSLHYMAPEQITGKTPVSARTDLYALGCSLFEMLTGKPPFSGITAGEILQKHLKEPVPSVAEIALDCPESLGRVVSRLLAKKPEERFQSAAEVALLLRELESGVAVKAPRTSAVAPRPKEKRPADPTRNDLAEKPVAERVTRLFAWGGWATAALVILSLFFSRWNDASGRSQTMRDELTVALRSPQPEVRQFALRIFVQIAPDDPGLRGTLTRMMNSDDDPAVRHTAREALVGIESQPRSRVLGYVMLSLALVTLGLFAWRGPALIRKIVEQAPPAAGKR